MFGTWRAHIPAHRNVGAGLPARMGCANMYPSTQGWNIFCYLSGTQRRHRSVGESLPPDRGVRIYFPDTRQEFVLLPGGHTFSPLREQMDGL